MTTFFNRQKLGLLAVFFIIFANIKNIDYICNMKKVKINNYNYLFPEKKEEINKELLLKIAPILLNYSGLDLEIMVLIHIITPRQFARLNVEQANELRKISKFIADKDFCYTDNPFSFYGLVGPSKSFGNVSVEQYIIAEIHFINFLKTGEPDALDKLVASLYIPKNKEFDENLLHLSKIKKIPEKYKKFILLYFYFCKIEMAKYYPYIYPKIDIEQIEQEPQTEKYGWGETLLNVAETGVFGNYKELCKMEVHNILFFLNKKAQDYQREVAQLQRQKNEYTNY